MKLAYLPFVALVLPTVSGLAGADFRATHDLTADDYNRWVERVSADGYRVSYCSVSSNGGPPRHSAVALENKANVGWLNRTNLTPAEFTALVAEQAKKDFRPTSVSGYLDGKESRYAAVWVRDKRPTAWVSLHGLNEREYEKEIATRKARGLRPDCVSAHADGQGVVRFAVLFGEAGQTEWVARHGLTDAEYQKVFDAWVPKGYRPISVTGYLTADGPRFALALVKGGPEWMARHDLTAKDYQTEFETRRASGLRPLAVVGYGKGVAAGTEAFDQAMRSFMKERSIPTGTITVSHHGRILFSKGYGHADRAEKRAILPTDPFRIASLSKPITAAAVRNLVARGSITLDTKAFDYLDLAPDAGKKPDPRLKDITIRHLLDHKGGWDRDVSFDPMFRPLEIAKDLRRPGPATANEVIRYMLGKPLDFAPGTKTAYSNFGYCVLGRVIEKATGQSYTAHIRKELLAPLKITTIDLGRTLPALRDSREPFYADADKGRNVMQPTSKVFVAAPDGTFHLEAMDSHGGLIASSVDLTRFLTAYWISGEPRKGGNSRGHHFGNLPGTFTLMMQHPSDLDVAVLFNQGADPSKKKYEDILQVMNAACKRVAAAELAYAAIWVKD